MFWELFVFLGFYASGCALFFVLGLWFGYNKCIKNIREIIDQEIDRIDEIRFGKPDDE